LCGKARTAQHLRPGPRENGAKLEVPDGRDDRYRELRRADARLSRRRRDALPPRASRAQEASGLGDWLAARGLAPVGDGIAMIRDDAPAPASKFQSFALAAQALG